MTNLMTAHHEWANRPSDERFWTLSDLHKFNLQQQFVSSEEYSFLFGFEFMAEEGDLVLRDIQNERTLEFTNWSFGQTCRMMGGPPDFLSRLPASLAAKNLNHLVKQRVDQDSNPEVKVLFAANDGRIQLKAMTGTGYARLWNANISRLLRDHWPGAGWVVPPARHNGDPSVPSRQATVDDLLQGRPSSLSIQVGDLIIPTLAASDRDMFVFMVNEGSHMDGPGQLKHGVFVRNSDVGGGSVWIQDFTYNQVCGNHIVWGAGNVQATRYIHRGNPDKLWDQIAYHLHDICNLGKQKTTERAFASANLLILGKDKDEVVDKLYARRISSRKILGASFDLADEHTEDGHLSACSALGMANGISRYSQTLTNADARVALDIAAGKVIDLSVN